MGSFIIILIVTISIILLMQVHHMFGLLIFLIGPYFGLLIDHEIKKHKKHIDKEWK